MPPDNATPGNRVVLVTGGARRLGAAIVETLHAAGWRVVIHYGSSAGDAQALCAGLDARRPESAACIAGDLADTKGFDAMSQAAIAVFGRIDALVNNAARFYPTPVGETDLAQWDDLFATNAKAPYFLAQALSAELRRHTGAIVNIVDLYAERPLPGHPVYCASKAALAMLTQCLAVELAPEVRVNAVAPGAILWPEQGGPDAARRAHLIARTPLKRQGSPGDIARAVRYLIEAPFVTGQILHVDGGRLLV